MPEPTDIRSGLVCVGLNYKTTPVEVRERLAFPEAQVPAAVRATMAKWGLAKDEFAANGVFAWHHWDLYETAINVALTQAQEK